jgi:DHA2 family multidrug resistance protein-like MFS transporter
MTTDLTTASRATRREWIGLVVLALPTLLIALDVSVLYLALPQLSTDLEASSTQQLWILDIYSFMIAGFLVTMGTLGDRIGRRRLLLIGAAAFGVASIAAAYSTSAEMLIVTRAILGIAGATLMPSTMALIRNMFPDPKQMQSALGLWSFCFMGGMALGPLVGGVLLERYWWGAAFLLGVPFMVLLLAIGPRLLPEYRDENAGRLDLRSVALSLVAILPLIYGLKEIARSSVSTGPVVAAVVGTAFGVRFIRRQRLLTNPLLDLGLFARPVFRTALGIMLLSGIVMAGISLMAAMYLQVVEGLSPLHAGLWMLPTNIVMAIGSLVAPALAARVGQAHVMTGGLLVCAAGFVLMVRVDGDGGLPLLIAGMILASGGISLPLPLVMGVVLGSAPPEKAGSAASLSETGAEFGIAAGVATLGTLGTVIYRHNFSAALPDGVPSAAADAARDSVTAATAVAGQLPGSVGDRLLDVAHNAFATGLNTVAAVGVVVFVGLAIATLAVLRDDTAETQQETPRETTGTTARECEPLLV